MVTVHSVIVTKTVTKCVLGSPAVIINGVKQHLPISQLITYLSSVPATNTETISINTNQLAENKLGSEEVTIIIESKKQTLDGYQITNSTYGQVFRKSSFKYGNYTDALLKYGNLSGNVSFGLNNRSLYSEYEENDYDGSKISSENRLKKFAYFGIVNFTWTPTPINGVLLIYMDRIIEMTQRIEEAKNTLVLELLIRVLKETIRACQICFR